MYSQNKLDNFNGIINLLNRFKFIDTFSFIQSNIRTQIPIIMYHHIGNKKDGFLLNRTNTIDFEKQLIFLKKKYEIINFERLIQAFKENKTLPKRTAIITFDDGYKNNYTEAFPLLKKYNIPATIFLTTGHIETDNTFWWDKIGYVLCNTKQKKN